MKIKEGLLRTSYLVAAILGLFLLGVVLGLFRYSANEVPGRRAYLLGEETVQKIAAAYSWVSPDNVFFIERSRRELRAMEVNVASGEGRPLKTLDYTKQIDDFDFNHAWITWSLSPNREWLLTYFSHGTKVLLSVTSLGGEKLLGPVVRQVAPLSFWFADNTRWLELVATNNGYNAVLRGFKIKEGRDLGITLPSGRPIGLVSDTVFLIVADKARGESEVDFVEVHLDTTTPALFRHRIKFPRAAEIFGAVLSPRGDNIVWQLGFYSRIPLLRFSRRSPFVELYRRKETAFFVSKSDGNELRRIDSLKDIRNSDAPLCWTADGKAISILKERTLWTVPITAELKEVEASNRQ